MVKPLNGNKAPNSDDFSLAFFQAFGGVFKDVMYVFHEFHAQRKFERSLITTFIALFLRRMEQ